MYLHQGELELLKLHCMEASFHCKVDFFLSLLLDTVECDNLITVVYLFST